MIKTLLVTAALVLGTSTFAMAASDSMGHPGMMMKHKKNRVSANGRCNGVSYGTGQRSCGTATGGTPGGNPSRN